MVLKLISQKKQARLDRYMLIKAEFNELIKAGSDKTVALEHLTVKHKASLTTVYKAIKTKSHAN